MILAPLRYFELYGEAKLKPHENNCDPVEEERTEDFFPFLGV